MEKSSNSKRPRKPNFSLSELEILVEEVSKNRDVLMGKFTDSITNEKKKRIWTLIATKINASSQACRSMDDVKKKWQDWSSSVKGKASKYEKERNRTGSGQMTEPALTPLEEKVLAVLGVTAVEGIATEMADTFIERSVETDVERVESTESQDVNVSAISTEDAQIEIERIWDRSINAVIERNNDVPSVSNSPSSTPSTSQSTQPVSSCGSKKRKLTRDFTDDESKIYALEKEKINIEKQRLEIEKERLKIEKSRQQCEQQILNVLQRYLGANYDEQQFQTDDEDVPFTFTCL
ncbi:myb/SANT-like DNA-binding domain-containing protein 4 [Pecten maximus]|uniref:myb/SANT-like DNA-binding domain-containing protein 4 n=1 Tax=Pecten maximus TaxID=6579 RepID=UPI001458CCD8|nr:myb/SANT-like DNA-binding domain-containing protein 4 [Pecten maximus]